MQETKQPIGYLIRQVDELLTQGINEIHSSLGLTRTDWQILNSIADKENIDKTALSAFMKPFADENAVITIVKKLEADSLIRDNGGKLSLTDQGFQLHKTCFEKQKLFRDTAMFEITEQQYQETISTLQKIIQNLAKR